MDLIHTHLHTFTMSMVEVVHVCLRVICKGCDWVRLVRGHSYGDALTPDVFLTSVGHLLGVAKHVNGIYKLLHMV